VLLRAFASGCTAMTGVEAVSNGVGAFKEPRVRTAQRTLTVIVIVLACLLGGVAYLARAYHVGAMHQDQPGYQSVLSQLTSATVGRGWLYYLTIGSVLCVLCLSANTSFVGFPRLSRMIAQDDFLPRGFAIVGRRLVYSVGILFLAGAAAALLIAFRGITDRLIPLFAVGAFMAFTLSQAGMVMHWRKELRQPGPEAGDEAKRKARSGIHLRLWVNLIGAIATGTALIVILIAKFGEGAWITIVAVPALLTLFRLVHRHYQKLNIAIAPTQPLNLNENPPPVVLVPTKGWDKLTNKALRFAVWLSQDVEAVHLSNLSGEAAEEEAQRVRAEWEREVEIPTERHGLPRPKLTIAQTPYRRFIRPLLQQIDRVKKNYPDRVVAVVIPEVVEKKWWEYLLHTRKPARLRKALMKRGDRRVVVITVPWYLD
jgi:hypothetical protein